jgi:hypothetical protein
MQCQEKRLNVVKTRKNFWGSLIISFGWCCLFILLEMLQYTSVFGWALFIGPLVALFATYQILRILQYVPDVLEKQEVHRPSQRRVDELMSKLSDEELDVLRDRLSDPRAYDYDSVGDMLVENRDKRKNR